MASIKALYFTCEHGGNRIPARWRPLFAGREAWLASHRGWDPGALKLARHLALAFDAPLEFSTTSRLLVELNRSIGHPNLFSAVTKTLPREERDRILSDFYFPYRERVEDALRMRIARLGRGEAVLHVSFHTFTPELNGEVRNADVAFLYDPSRVLEKRAAKAWRGALAEIAPGLQLRMNYPYRGTEDGFATYLRRQFSATRYLGIEIEVNQAIAAGPEKERSRIAKALGRSLRTVMET